ncbi:MAG: hypothetical protein ACOCUS_01930 [Polyangiales bacterium]
MRKAGRLFAMAAMLVAGSTLNGCGDDGATPDSGPTDGGGTDSGYTDAGGDDAGGEDAGGTDGGSTCEVTDWSAPDFETNAATALALRTQIADLSGFMDAHRDDPSSAPISSVDDLNAYYEDMGDPSLSEAITAEYDTVIGKAFNDMVALADVGVVSTATDGSGAWDGGPDGGIFEFPSEGVSHALNGAGIEPEQLVDKGMFAAVSYNYALTLTEGEITPATIDSLAAAWGTNATFDTDDTADAAGYSYSMGFHEQLTGYLEAAKSYAAADGCDAELEEAVVDFFRFWEIAIMARAVYYNYNGLTGVGGADSDAVIVDELHAWAEGVGLALGFYGMPDPESGPLVDEGRVITDAQIEEMMDAIYVDLDTADTFNDSMVADELVGAEPSDIEERIGMFESPIMEAYGVTEEDVEGWYEETPG